MLVEYALIPDIFDANCYDYPELCSARIEYIKDVILEEALVRDLRKGEWRAYLQTCMKKDEYCWPSRSKELIKKLIKQYRLRPVSVIKHAIPSSYIEWCQEAVDSHNHEPLSGVITTQSVATAFSQTNIVASIDRLSSADWWRNRSPSVRLYRTTNDYLLHLQLLLCHANSIMFIDPYFDPVKHGYREFNKLLAAIINPDEPPVIEIHMCHLADSMSISQYEEDFRRKLLRVINQAGLTVEVFIWDKLHDRYLISNLMGVKLNNGFDVSDNPKEMTTWGRLGRADRDDIQREFDPASKRHKLQYRFTVS
ncbi:MAG: hypothetical protein V7L20_14370 [Nostoc sp.]|uniref:hypothetical protein n=1 Tax=Nostoc sp. TaxID=1180 RepID=UPI002FF79EB0